MTVFGDRKDLADAGRREEIENGFRIYQGPIYLFIYRLINDGVEVVELHDGRHGGLRPRGHPGHPPSGTGSPVKHGRGTLLKVTCTV